MRKIAASLLLSLAVLVMACLTPVASAATSSSAVAQEFAATTGATVPGSIVSVQPQATQKVELATSGGTPSIVGVIGQNPLVTLSSGTPGVRVITSGTASTLVSDINGQIHVGDKIAASPIAGVGMLATSNVQVVGTAAANFNVITAKSQTITDRHGASHTVYIQELALQVAVSYYVAPSSNFLPPFAQNFANSIAGKQVSSPRIFIASILAFFGAISILVLIYSAGHSGIISIGRNPLAANAIRRGFIEVGLFIVLLGAFTVIVVDLILTL